MKTHSVWMRREIRCRLVVVGLGCASLVVSGARSQSLADPNWSVGTYATGFDQPTGIKFLGGDTSRAFVIEKNTGRVVHYTAAGGLKTPVLDLNVANDSERGLLGIALHPQFSTNGFVYLYYSASDGGDGGTWTRNQLSRFTWNGSSLGSETPIATFGTSTDGIPGQGPNHDGGPIRFGADGKLYGITGDLNRDGIEQNNAAGSSVFTGGVFRLNDDGSVPADNPFVSNPDPNVRRWYAVGVRNSFGIAFDPVTNALWDTENGPTNYDEVNRVDAGFNSGWKDIMGPDSRDPQGVGDLAPLGTYSDPEFSWLDTVAPTGIEFLAGSVLGPAYDDKVIVADSNLGNLYLFTLNGARDGFVLGGDLADLVADTTAERNAVRIGQDFGSLTELVVGPDGALYVVSIGDGAIYQIIPEPPAVFLVAAALALIVAGQRRRGWRG